MSLTDASSRSSDSPSHRDLAIFGLLLGTMTGFVFGLLLPWLASHAFPWWPWVVATAFWVWAVSVPGTLRPVYWLWMRLAMAINWAMTRLVLGATYYGVVVPIGLVMRVSGRDPMARQFDSARPSYRTPSDPLPRDHLERPF